jgi:hypothetical protein
MSITDVELLIEGNRDTFEPGQAVRGEARWSADSPPTSASVSLVYYTEGKGDQDVGIARTITFDPPPMRGDESFEIDLPLGPLSFDGRLISLKWALELNVEPGGVARKELAILPGGQAIKLEEVEADNPISGLLRRFRAQRA